MHQLEELLSNYGEVFAVWFDGACGEGPNGKKQIYHWERYYEVILRLQPNACITVSGPDVRWCGNEAGNTRPSEWSVVPERTRDTEKIAENSQRQDDVCFRQRKISAHDNDLGSREVLEKEEKLIWYPAEVNTSIRPGWFYHLHEDDKVKPLSELIKIYDNSVGGNATFLLNIPPNKDGLFHENDVKRLHEIGDYLNKAYENNLMDIAKLKADSCMDGHEIENVRIDQYGTYYKTEDGINNSIIHLKWDEKVKIEHIVLKENIMLSQRIENFTVEAKIGEDYMTIYEGTTVGYKKIISINTVRTAEIRIHIMDARVAPTLSFIGVY